MAVKKMRKVLFLAVLLSLILTALMMLGGAEKEQLKNHQIKATLTAEEQAQMTNVIGENGKSNYVIIFSQADGFNQDYEIANELKATLKSNFGVNVYPRVDSTAEKTYEILIGETNRAFSAEVMAEVKKATVNNNLVWAIAEKDGKIAYLANSEDALKRGKTDLYAYITETNFSVPTGTFSLHTLSRAEYDAELKAEQDRLEWEKEQMKAQRIEELKKLIAEFTYDQFGDAPATSMRDNTGSPFGYGYPAVYPNAGEHPRVNVTSYMIPEILKYMETEEAKYTVAEFWKLVNTEYTGILPAATEHTTGRVGFHNMDEKGLAIIEAKAFAYLLTGDEYYAYEAIYAMKNFLVTIDIQRIHSDQCREFGRILYCTAEVYDWCYSLLTENDKAQFIMACADIGSSRNQNTDFGNQMEVGFPPRLQGCVSGHGSEHQVLRDYLSIAIAIFDEDPTWYQWCGGLVFNYYIPFRDYYFTSGTYPQGLNVYAPHRFDADMWSAWLLLCATGEIPYSTDFSRVAQSFFQHETPGGSLFSTGDGGRQGNGSAFWHIAAISAALYGDMPLRSQAYKHSGGFRNYTASSMSFSFTQMLFLSAEYYNKIGYDAEPVDPYSESDPVCYFGSPLGQMTVRSQWNDTYAAATFMKIGERNTSNHEHDDQGTFQIYYKGLYTGDTGIYDTYGSTHWSYYHTQTVAHNGLLIFNPAKSGDDPNNPATYYYSGGQRSFGEANNLDVWLQSTYDTGTVTGSQWAYKDDGTTDYAYLGGDITAAYDPTEVTHVGRQMLTLYTDNPEVPMYFIVHDKITALDSGYKKTFLLHTTRTPYINQEDKSFWFIDGSAKLTLKNLLGGDNIEAVGGQGMTFAINGRNCAPNNGSAGNYWGRVEISPNTGNLTDDLLNFIYVTDMTSTATVTPTLIQAENMNGLLVDDQAIIFANSEDENNSAELNFSFEGTGLYRYIVMGMFMGTWNISVDGVTVAHSVSSEEGGMITFYAPAGDVKIAPGKDIAPSNGGRIIYNAFGGIVPDEAPLVFEIGVPVKLPQDIKNGLDKFLGWYTSPTFEPETLVTEFVGTEKGKVNLYAKYSGVAAIEDYEAIELDDNKITLNNISYNGKDGTVFKTIKDEKTGNTYLHVTRGTKDPQIDIGKKPNTYLYSDTKLTLVIDLARDEGTPMNTNCRLRVSSSADVITYFSTNSAGTVSFGGKVPVMTLTESFQTLAITLDFAAEVMTAYDGDGNVLETLKMSVPEAAAQTDLISWLNATTTSMNWWLGQSGDSILIDNLSLYAGAYEPKVIELPEGYGKITYKTNGGSFVTPPSKMYKEGEVTLLEPNIINGNDKFLGWYTTPDFQKGTMIAEIPADAKGEITVYAKWAGKIIEADFEGESVDLSDGTNLIVDGITLGSNNKNGVTFKTEQDASGNTYIRWTRGTQDPQVNYGGTLGKFTEGRVATFMIDLMMVDGEACINSLFRVRSSKMTMVGGTNNSVPLFTTDTGGNVKLGGSVTIATLNSYEFTKIIASMNFDTNEIIAYKPDGEEIARTTFEMDNADEWLSGMSIPMNWYASGGGSICFDNIMITNKPFSPIEDALPSTMGKIDYMTNGGRLNDDAPKYYEKGTALTLPIPTRDNAVFLGWYKDAALTEKITEITAEDTENFILYASWQIVMADLKAEDYPDIDIKGPEEGKTTGGGPIGPINFQTKGENSYAKGMTDENGEAYILWSKGTSDPQLNYGGNLAALSGGNKVITISLTFAKDGDNPFMAFQARIRTNKNFDNAGTSTAVELGIFKFTANGNLYLAKSTSSDMLVGTFGEEFKTLSIVLDFAQGMIIGYDENGIRKCETPMNLPAYVGTAEDYYKGIDRDIMNIYASGADGSARIKRITIQTSNIFAAAEEELEKTQGTIKYVTNGGTLPEGAPLTFKKGEALALPTPTMPNANFLGWYKDQAFTEPITEISAEETENVTVYAYWQFVMLDVNAEELNIAEGDSKFGGMTIGIKGENCYIKSAEDELGGKYLVWSKGTSDPQLNYGGTLSDVSGGNKVITFSLTFAKDGESNFIGFQARMRTTASYENANGTKGRRELKLFRLSSSGALFLGEKSSEDMIIGYFGEEFKTLHVVADFETGKLTGYDENGTKKCELDMTIPEPFTTLDEYYKAFNADIMNVYASGADASIRIKQIKVQTHNLFADNEQAPECTEHTDADADGICDTCGADVPAVEPEVTPETPEENEAPEIPAE